MKKVLIFARSNSPFKTVRRDHDYIISNLIDLGYSIDIYDPKQRILMDLETKTIHSYNLFPSIFYKLKINIFLNFLSLIYFSRKNKNKYNIVQINYLREEYLVIPKLINNIRDKLVICLFGSDINHRTIIKNNFTKIYDKADAIIASTLNFAKTANSYVKENIILNKLNVLLLPQDHFKYYSDFTFENKTESKLKLNYPLDKIIVVLGTNSTENEQHEKMIEEVKKIPDLSRFHFIINLSNRLNTVLERERNIEELLKREFKSISYSINIRFLSYEEMALVRHATDIFVNMRKIDQLAVSLMESNLGYANVITGKWLPYIDYTSEVKTTLIDSIEDLSSSINIIANSIDSENNIKILQENRKKVIEKYDSNVINDWLNFYKKLSVEN